MREGIKPNERNRCRYKNLSQVVEIVGHISLALFSDHDQAFEYPYDTGNALKAHHQENIFLVVPWIIFFDHAGAEFESRNRDKGNVARFDKLDNNLFAFPG